MTDQTPRRPSVPPAPPPPAPPLPPPRYTAARSVFSRFVTQSFSSGYGSRPPSVQANRGEGGRASPPPQRTPGISAVSSQEASHKTGLEISALDINHEKTHAILAGREILKTIRVFGTHCSEEINLRAAIINYASHNASGSGPPSRRRDAFEIHDVKWSHGQYSSHIATAAASGNVILYDLNRAGVELARLHEHHRQVHKVAFNPHQGYLLLSGSQDATVRLWDLREMRKDIMTCASRDRYSGAAEAVRDLKWSPTDGVEFAFGTDSGVIQRWDYRMTNKPKLKIQAHDKPVNSIDWHLDGKHVLSASIDKTVRIWNFSSEARRQKPAWVIRTPFAVYNARWRPPSWYAGSHDVGSWRCTQLATSYDRDHGVVHVWDLRRPFLPFREIHRYNAAPTDMLWHSRDLLWTVGREGMFTQNDVHFSPKLMERRNMQAFAVSSGGEVGGFTQKRPRRRGSGIELLADDSYAPEHSNKRESPEKSSLGRSSVDDTVDEGFLSSSFKRHHGRTASNRSAKSYGSTPPSYDATGKVMLLQDSLNVQIETSKPNQVAFRGVAPGFMSVPNFTYLAQKYKTIPLPDPPTLESFANLSRLFEQNAEYARRAALYRQAQTWMLIGHWLSNVVNDRAEEHRRLRVEQRRRISSGMEVVLSHAPAQDGRSLQIPNAAVRAIQASGVQQHQTIQTTESTSNLPTPLAKPIANANASVPVFRQTLLDPDKDESISLPPAIAGPHSQESKHIPAARGQSLKVPTPNFNGSHWLDSDDLDERRAIAGSYRAQTRMPLTLEPVRTEAISINAPPALGRHNSDESFAMFSSSSDSQKGPSMASSYASHKSYSNNMESIPEKWQESLPGSSLGEGHSDASDSPTLSRRMSMGPHDLHGVHSVPMDVPKALSPRAKAGEPSGPPALQSEMSSAGFRREQTKTIQDIETLHRQNQFLRHDSSESEALLSSKASFADSRSNEQMEASGTIVPDEASKEVRSPSITSKPPPALPHEAISVPAAIEPGPPDEAHLLSDYLAKDFTFDTEKNSPFTVVDMVSQTLEYAASSLSDAQSASILLLLAAPLLPPTNPLDEAETRLIVSTYVDVFTSMGMSPSQIQAVTTTHLANLLETGLNPFQAEAILTTYHTQLHSLNLFNPAASLRRLAYPIYPAVYDAALKDTQLGLLCQNCKNPINNPLDKSRCESCRKTQAPCPICWQKYPAIDQPLAAKKKLKARRQQTVKFGIGADLGASIHSAKSDLTPRAPQSGPPGPSSASKAVSFETAAALPTPAPAPAAAEQEDGLSQTQPVASAAGPAPALPTLWTWCPLCGHGAHAACLAAWHADLMNLGACPTEGCLCDCVKGARRDERLRKGEERRREREARKVVRGDEWSVRESRAVVGAARALGDGVGAGSGVGSGGVSGNGSGGKKDGEGRRVRLVEPRNGGRK